MSSTFRIKSIEELLSALYPTSISRLISDTQMAPKFGKSSKKSNKLLEDLNDYCLDAIIEKLPLRDRFKLRLNRRLKHVVERNLNLVKGLQICRNARNCCDSDHSTLYLAFNGLQSSDLLIFNDDYKSILKTIFKFCPNIKCIEMSAEIDLKLMVWMKRQCKQLECLQINNSVINTRLTSRQWIQIGDTLSDKLTHLSIHSMANPERLSEFGLIYLIQNLKYLKEFSFDVNELSLDKIGPFFGQLPYLKTLKLNKCYKYKVTQNTFDILKQNLPNLENLEIQGYDIQTLELICDNFPNLKRLNIFFFSSWPNMDSLQQLSRLRELKHLKIEFFQNRGIFNFLAHNEFTQLESLHLTGISFTPLMFENFYLYFPNIEQLVLQNCSLLCDDRSDDYRNRQDCNDCKERVWNHVSKLEHLKQLSINLLPRRNTGFSKAFVWMLNDQSFRAIEELDFQWLPYDQRTFMDNLLTPLMKFAAQNPKRSFKLKVNSDYFEYVTKKRLIHGIKFNVLSPNIPHNLKIICRNS